MTWLDYASVLQTTGLPIQFWRMLSTFAVTFFVVRGLDVFDTIQKREMKNLQEERDQAQQKAIETEIIARQTAENWTNALVNINRRIAELENVDSILLSIIENAQTLLHSDFIGLALLKDEEATLHLRCFSSNRGAKSVTKEVPIDNPLIWKAIHDSRSYCFNRAEASANSEGLCFPDDPPAQSLAIVHLSLDNAPIGAMWLVSFDEHPYSETDLIWLEYMADQVVIAIQHGLMTAQLQSLSIIEERGRIARDMHDGVAQVLGYLNLQLQTLEALWKRDKKDSFQEELIQMRQAIQSANADVRESILSLRTTLANEKGLITAMAEYIEEFGLQTGIELEFTNSIASEEDIDLSSIAEVQLVCILQEALTNVRKHACATQVFVKLMKETYEEGEYIQLQVSDNGVGFVMHESKRSFGLKTMHERASSVNGELFVNSQVNHGTTVLCILPCLEAHRPTLRSLILQ